MGLQNSDQLPPHGSEQNQVGSHAAQWTELGEDGLRMNESCNSLEQESRKREIALWEE